MCFLSIYTVHAGNSLNPIRILFLLFYLLSLLPFRPIFKIFFTGQHPKKVILAGSQSRVSFLPQEVFQSRYGRHASLKDYAIEQRTYTHGFNTLRDHTLKLVATRSHS